jgi:hypothetical protein
MPTETFKTDYGNIPKLTENNYPRWKEKVRRALMGADAYYIVTRKKPEPEGNTANSRTEQRNRRTGRNDVPAIIYIACSDEILPQIRITINPVDMWDKHHRSCRHVEHPQRSLWQHALETRSKVDPTQIPCLLPSKCRED